MNINDANLILDRHKEGTHAYSMLTITKALFITGDISEEPGTLGTDGKDTWMERAQLVESQTT